MIVKAINTELLRQKMKEKSIGPDEVSKMMGIDRATFYRKLKAGGIKFTLAEIQRMIAALGLSDSEAVQIFFTETVA